MDKEKRTFVIQRGVLGTGLPVAILMSLTAGLQVPGYLFRFQSFNYKMFLISLLLFTPIFMVAGYFWGIIVYKIKNRKGG